jgi:hypothetical protein
MQVTSSSSYSCRFPCLFLALSHWVVSYWGKVCHHSSSRCGETIREVVIISVTFYLQIRVHIDPTENTLRDENGIQEVFNSYKSVTLICSERIARASVGNVLKIKEDLCVIPFSQ